MGRLIEVIGASGVGKTTLVNALSRIGRFATAYEEHIERPFQVLFDQEKRYGLANQMDYLILRAEQERKLRGRRQVGLIDGGLDLDYHGFTRLFHAHGWLGDPEFELCRRFYELTRHMLPLPDLIVHLTASEETIRGRLAARPRINIASAEDTPMFNLFLDEWMATLPEQCLLHIDITKEGPDFRSSAGLILDRIKKR